MKSHLTKLSLALLLTVFLLGCQEQGSDPVGPEGPQFDKKGTGSCAAADDGGHCHGDGDGTTAATLDLAFGMTTTVFNVNVNQDSRNKLNVGNSDFVHPIQMSFTAPGVCSPFTTKRGVAPTPEEIVELKLELGLPVTSGGFIMKIDKTGLTVDGVGTMDDDHLLVVERDGTFDGANGLTRIMLGSPFDDVGAVTVKWVSQDVFEFTGPVVVWAHGVGGGGVKSNRIIVCDGEGNEPNKVVATVNR